MARERSPRRACLRTVWVDPLGALLARTTARRVTDDVPSSIAKELEAQAPTIVTLLEQAEREAEERQRKWEIERREMEKREAERQRIEREAQREKEMVETIRSGA